jgi:hypothetical protein
MAEQKIIGKVAMTLGGEWSASATYDALVIVTHQGSSWVSKKDVSVGNEPSDGSEYWQLLAAQGEPRTIVNDLTTGGEDAALSAEQGKALKSYVDSAIASAITNVLNTEV